MEGRDIEQGRKKNLNTLWRQQRPRAERREETMSKVRAMDRLARRTAHEHGKTLVRDVKLAINNGIKDDPDLRSVGVTDRERWALTTVTLNIIAKDVTKPMEAANHE